MAEDRIRSQGDEVGTSCGLVSGATAATGFETRSYDDVFTEVSHRENLAVLSSPAYAGDSSLRIQFEGDSHYGASLEYVFDAAGEPEPEELYARFALRFGASWTPDRNGKLPGFAGTYDRAGWGGRPVSGDVGWSARGRWSETETPGKTRIG